MTLTHPGRPGIELFVGFILTGWGRGRPLALFSVFELPHRNIQCDSSLRNYSAYCQKIHQNPSKSIKIHCRGTYFQTFPKRVHAPRVPWEDSHNLMYIVLYGCHSICVNSLGGSGRINSSEDIFTPLGQKREGAWVRVQRVSLTQDMKTWIFTYTDIRAKYRGLLYTFKIC